MALLLPLCLHPPNPPQNPASAVPQPAAAASPDSATLNSNSKRHFILKTASLSLISLFPKCPLAQSSEIPPSSKQGLPRLANTKSWFQFYGDGFSIRVPPQFEDLTEPEIRDVPSRGQPYFYCGKFSLKEVREYLKTSSLQLSSTPSPPTRTGLLDYSAGLSLYGDKAKTKTFAAQFGSSDGSEVLSVVTRPTNQLKITFLEAKDITDIGTLREAAKIFVPGGANLFSARTFKIKEDDNFRTYYFYEFGKGEQHVALVATVNSGQVFVAGATAPLSKWDEDGIKLRSAAISLTVL